MTQSRPLQAVSCALLVLGVVFAWGATLLFTLQIGIVHLPLSLVQSLLLGLTAPTKFRLRALPRGLFLWFVVMTVNQSLALVWLLGYAIIEDWAHSTSYGDMSALYLIFLAVAVTSTVLTYRFRHQLHRVLS